MYSGIPIKYFMWAHQHSTQDNIQRYAEELFKEISPRLRPQVFLLGILQKEGKVTNGHRHHPICIQPEECGINVELFNDVRDVAKAIWENDDRRRVFHGMPYIHEDYHFKIRKDATRKAIQQLVNKNFDGKRTTSFVSRSVDLENYEIFVVLQFDDDAYGSFYGLSGSKLHRRSFLNSLIWMFLEESLDTMYRPRAALTPQDISTDKKEVMRMAASHFVMQVVSTVCSSEWSREFFDICNYVSSLKYEGDSSVGKLIVCNGGQHPNLETVLKFAIPIQLTKHRKIRKLLEVTSTDLSLIADGTRILGLGKIKGNYDEKDQNLLVINFNGSYKWELVHDTHMMLAVERTNPTLPKPKIDKEIFDDLLQRTFSEISLDALEKLWIIVNAATTQKHGALLIISDEAERESARLSKQSIVIESTMLDVSLIRSITSIDGATLLDDNGVCHSIGVILDGTASDKGTSERGARYNSAIRYVEFKKRKCVAIIISEDGMVDLYPNLLPRIKKNDIKEHLDRLRIQSKESVLDVEEYHDIMRWFDLHEFYLSQEQCVEINKIKRMCYDKKKSDPYRLFVLWNDLKPNSDMNNSYFIGEDTLEMP